MNILLFGSTGMLGTALEQVCKNRDLNCYSALHKDTDITDPDDLKQAIEKFVPDVIINAAALVGIAQCEYDPQKTFDVNTIAVSYLARLCEEKNIVFVQISSSSVFDGTKNDYYTEDDCVSPTASYSASKYVAECFTKTFCSKHYIIRLPLLFGPRQNRGERFVDMLIGKLQSDEKLEVSIDKIDSPTYTIDAANVILDIVEGAKPFGLYHVANHGKVSLYEFVSQFVKVSSSNLQILKAKDKDFKSPVYTPLALPLKSVKLRPLRSWKDALQEYITKSLQIKKL